MKNLFNILLLCVGVLFATNSYAVISTASNPNETETQDAKIGINDLKTLSVKEIEAKIGHDLTWKQKLAIKVLNKTMFRRIKSSFFILNWLGVYLVVGQK